MLEARRTLSALRRAGVLDAVDAHVALRLGRRGGVENADVMTALALAVRAPRHGHECVDLQTAQTATMRPPEAEGDAPALPVDRDQWIADVAASGMVQPGTAPGMQPFCLVGSKLYTDRYWRYQQLVAQRLTALARRPLRSIHDPAVFKAALDQLFRPADGKPEAQLNRQRLAAAVATLRDLTVITGGPGMGKTWTVRNILALALLDHPADAPPLRIALCAPSGKAAVRLREALTEDLRAVLLPALESVVGADQAQAISGHILRLEAITIHRLLEWQPASPTRFKHNCDRPLLADLVVVDECSMIDLAMLAKLLDAIGPETRVVMLGDANQLASVEAGTALSDICSLAPGGAVASPPLRQALTHQAGLEHIGQIEDQHELGLADAIVQFNKNHRFAEDSPIGQLAQACLHGGENVQAALDLFGIDDALQRTSHSAGQLSSQALSQIEAHALEVMSLLSQGPQGQPEQVFHRRVLDTMDTHRVLCAHRRGPLGSVQLNQQLADRLRRGANTREQAWEGQPIIVRVNDNTVGRSNGDVGMIVRQGDALVAAFPGPDPLPRDEHSAGSEHLNLVEYLALARLPEHESCFAMTIHKAQGSQWPHITVVLPAKPSPVLTRELIYTAITRAQETVTVLGDEAILGHALSTPIQRASGLAEALESQASQ